MRVGGRVVGVVYWEIVGGSTEFSVKEGVCVVEV